MIIIKTHIFILLIYLLQILFFNHSENGYLKTSVQITTVLSFLYILREIFTAWYSGMDCNTHQPLNLGKIITVGGILIFLLIPSIILAFFLSADSTVLPASINFTAMLFSSLIIRMASPSDQVEVE